VVVHVDGPAFYDDTARKTGRVTRGTIAEERPDAARVSATNTQATFGNSRRHCNLRRVCKREYVYKEGDRHEAGGVRRPDANTCKHY
jgi:hypothetical protein